MGKHHITALLYDKRNRLLAVGQNSYVVTHPFMAKCGAAVGEPDKVFLHAEVAALLKVRNWSRINKIVITRYTKDGCPALAKPCKACAHALALAGVKNIYYTQ